MKPTAKQKKMVIDLAQWGFSRRDIAHALGISVTMLKRHFDEEILTGRARRKLEVVTMLWDAAEAGSVPAMLQIYRMIETRKFRVDFRRGAPVGCKPPALH